MSSIKARSRAQQRLNGYFLMYSPFSFFLPALMETIRSVPEPMQRSISMLPKRKGRQPRRAASQPCPSKYPQSRFSTLFSQVVYKMSTPLSTELSTACVLCYVSFCFGGSNFRFNWNLSTTAAYLSTNIGDNLSNQMKQERCAPCFIMGDLKIHLSTQGLA